MFISINWIRYNFDANLDASNNIISGNEPGSDRDAYKPKSKYGMSQNK